MYNIYKITNKINGKVYVGQTVKSPKVRFREHCTKNPGCPYLKNAILKYGKDQFEIELIETCDTLDQSNDRDGGSNGKIGEISNETRLKLSISHKGKKRKPFSKEHRNRISEAKTGKRRSVTICKKLSESQT